MYKKSLYINNVIRDLNSRTKEFYTIYNIHM